MSKHLPAHFTAAAESYLSGQRDIEVQALSFSDIARIASGDAPLNFDAYRRDEDGNLVPVLVTVLRFRGDRALVNTTYGYDEATGRLDRSAPVGARLTLHIADADGIGEGRGHLFTTKAAEKAATASAVRKMDRVNMDDAYGAKATRKSLFLPLDSEVFNDDSTGKVSVKPLAAFHGSKVTASFVVEGIAPSALEAKIHLFLAEEFGGLAGNVADVEAHPVRDQRVDVFDPISGSAVALGILAAEVDLLPAVEFGGYVIEPSLEPDDTVIVGR